MKLRSIACLLGPVLLAASGAAVPAEDPPPAVPEDLVERGRFHGSWVYKNRDERIALFIEADEGEPRVRWRYEGRRRPDAFETGWDGAASYFVEGKPASFRLDLLERGEHLMRGKLAWTYPMPRGVTKKDEGEFVMYRSGNGRQLVLHFEGFEQTLTHPEREPRSRVDPRVWIFVKASKRIVRWEELPH
jgi:hypothetical protein